MNDVISTRQAATLLGVSQPAVNKLVNGGKIEAIKLGKEWAISKASTLAYKVKREKRLRRQLERIQQAA